MKSYKTKADISAEIMRFYGYRKGLEFQMTLKRDNRLSLPALQREHDRVALYMKYLSALKTAKAK